MNSIKRNGLSLVQALAEVGNYGEAQNLGHELSARVPRASEFAASCISEAGERWSKHARPKSGRFAAALDVLRPKSFATFRGQ